MSVPVGKRKPTTLKVLDDVRILSRHTVQKCKNERIFPKRNRWILTQPIVNECLQATACIRRANATFVHPGNEDEYNYRHMQQVEAHAHLNALYDLLDIAYDVLDELHEDESIYYWTGLIYAADSSLKNWMESDTQRFNQDRAQRVSP
jgi:hypothetical protein